MQRYLALLAIPFLLSGLSGCDDGGAATKPTKRTVAHAPPPPPPSAEAIRAAQSVPPPVPKVDVRPAVQVPAAGTTPNAPAPANPATPAPGTTGGQTAPGAIPPTSEAAPELDDRAADQLTALRHVHCVAFSPSGKTLATGSESGAITIWNAETGERKQVLPGHKSAPSHISFSPDSSLLLSSNFEVGGNRQAAFKVWDLTTSKLMREYDLSGYQFATPAIFSGDNRYVISSLDREVAVLDVGVGITRKRTFDDGKIQAVSCSRGSNIMAVAIALDPRRSQIRMLDLSQDESEHYRTLAGQVDRLTYCEKGNALLAAVGPKLFVWQVDIQEDGGVSFNCPVPEGFVKFGRLVSNASGAKMAVQAYLNDDRRSPVQVWEVGSQKLVDVPNTNDARDLDFGADGTLAVVLSDGRVQLYDSQTLLPRQ